MILNMNLQSKTKDTTTLESVLEFLNKDEANYYLTGSRYFNHHEVNADYDFFTHNTRITERILTKFGFREIEDSLVYNNSDLNHLYEFKTSDLATIQIQLVKSDKIKMDIQNNILQQFGESFGLFTKENRKSIWQLCLNLYKS